LKFKGNVRNFDEKIYFSLPTNKLVIMIYWFEMRFFITLEEYSGNKCQA